MIVEELAARFGFSVEGVQKLRAAVKEMKKAKVVAKDTGKSLSSTGRGAVAASAGSARLGTALRTILGVFARLAVVAAGVAAGLVVVGTAFVIPGVRAARARREFVLTAKEMGTTGQNLETLGNILRVAGFGDGFEEEAKKVAGAVDEISKAVRKGGDEAVEAKKKIAGFGIDKSFDVDPKTGKSRDSVAIALDLFQAYKRATEQAADLRKEADAVAGKAPKKAAALRKKALAQDQKTEQFAADAGINGRLRVLLDNTPLKDFPELFRKASSWFPTTSNKSEARQDDVAKQAEEASLKLAAIWGGLAERFTEFGQILANEVLPPLNKFLDALVSFAKATGIISENVAERDERVKREKEAAAANLGRLQRLSEADPATLTPTERMAANRYKAFKAREQDASQRYGTPTTAPLPPERPRPLPARDKDLSPAPEGWLQYFRNMLSPETNAAKLQKTVEQNTDQRKYENFGNDQRTVAVSIQQTIAGGADIAAATARGVNRAVSMVKASNAQTAGTLDP